MKITSLKISWKASIVISVVLLVLVMFSNFYGLLTDKFHFDRPSSYFFILLATVHIVYLYAFWFKLTENEYPDKEMRNLEYGFYAVVAFYAYKLVDITSIVFGYSTYDNLILSGHFLVVGIAIILGYLFLCLITLYVFSIRKAKIGNYTTDCYVEEDLDTWP
ncbi:hypothetical protein M4I21_01025 [Cellulophaga sp. 20_2_10]|uniref:hypothetical protein n=1 Tax=Cellulophaga sp. 20_2_10 TaxID=2942476 RepID=UPI00201AE78C|nr:hypothetical protein [Cellulophaga sp. 20_2_10]MCL5244369.1 hypothetical protein [Cellulophaga sp. 20_2_10]